MHRILELELELEKPITTVQCANEITITIINMGRKFGAGWVPWVEAYVHTKWHLDASSSLATIEVDQKLGGGLRPPIWEGGLGLHLTQSGLG